jgi:hypothetical protein
VAVYQRLPKSAEMSAEFARPLKVTIEYHRMSGSCQPLAIGSAKKLRGFSRFSRFSIILLQCHAWSLEILETSWDSSFKSWSKHFLVDSRTLGDTRGLNPGETTQIQSKTKLVSLVPWLLFGFVRRSPLLSLSKEFLGVYDGMCPIYCHLCGQAAQKLTQRLQRPQRSGWNNPRAEKFLFYPAQFQGDNRNIGIGNDFET